jgi:cell division protein FtsI (penicillin-binding protein 3)
VVVDSSRNGRIYGADVAAPVFREVADKCMARDLLSQRPLLAKARLNKSRVPMVRAGMQDELALVCQKLGLAGQTQATGGEEWVRAASDTAFHARTVALVVNPVRVGYVPQVKGLTLRDALFLLENRGLHVRAIGTGRVKDQSLAVGSRINRGDIITLSLAETGPRITAPQALPEPEHTELAENKLLTPADPEPLAKKLLAKPFATSAKAKVNPTNHSTTSTAATKTNKSTAQAEAAKAKPTTSADKSSSKAKTGAAKPASKDDKKPTPAKPAVHRA